MTGPLLKPSIGRPIAGPNRFAQTVGRPGAAGRTGASSAELIGLLAGSGRFPILFAEAAQRQGLRVACVGIKYEYSDELRALCTSLDVVGVAKLGKMIRKFRRQGVKRIVMAGKVTKNVIYTPWRIVQLCPDLRTLQWWYRRSRADNRDDSLLLSVIDEFERDGMTFASALDYCPELLVKEGILTRRAPTAAERATSSSAGIWPKRWAGWTLASRWPSRKKRLSLSRPSRGRTAALNAPACFAGPEAGLWSRLQSPSKT